MVSNHSQPSLSLLSLLYGEPAYLRINEYSVPLLDVKPCSYDSPDRQQRLVITSV